jgi:NTE family protein
VHSGRPRVGLVLGAGGILGGAWTAGALDAISRATGWEPLESDLIIGTSAGSVFAALLSGGIPARRLLPEPGREWLLSDLVSSTPSPAAAAAGLRAPGSWRLAVRALTQRPTPFSLARAWSGLKPAGRVSTARIEDTVRRVVPSGWAPRAGCLVVATDYEDGSRVVLGDGLAERCDLARAVAASCAVPGLFEPVTVRGRRLVDGGLRSLTNLDLARGRGLDLVVCVSPMSARRAAHVPGHLGVVRTAIERVAAAEVDREAAVLRSEGVRVVVLEPGPYTAALMGDDLMETSRCGAVAERAHQLAIDVMRRSGFDRELAALSPAA